MNRTPMKRGKPLERPQSEQATQRMNKSSITPAALAAAATKVFFNPETGEMRWRARCPQSSTNRAWNAKYAGKRVGTLTTRGYLRFRLKEGEIDSQFPVHWLAWFIVHGVAPSGVIDHKNGNPLDNRIENLREVTSSQNSLNRRRAVTNKSGVKGVNWYPERNSWRAQCTVDGKRKYIGIFKNLADAEAAVRAFREMAHGQFANHG